MVSGRFDGLEGPRCHLGSIGECTHSEFPLTMMELDGPFMLAWCLHGDVVWSQWWGVGNEKRWHDTEVKMWVLYSGLPLSSFVALGILIKPPNPNFVI